MTLGPASVTSTRSEKSASLDTMVRALAAACCQILVSLQSAPRSCTNSQSPPDQSESQRGRLASIRYRATSRGRLSDAVLVAHQAAGEGEAGLDVLRLKHGVLAQDLLGRLARAQVVENGLDRHAEAPDDGLAVADVGVDGDAVDVAGHVGSIARGNLLTHAHAGEVSGFAHSP